MKRLYVLFILLTILTVPVLAQDAVPVPDLTGLGVPQAASILNLVGLNLGNQAAVDPEAGQETNKIVGQSLAPGTSAPRGTMVDVSVVLPPNMHLIYDDNDITIQNLTDGTMTLGGVTFRSTGDGAATFDPTQLTNALIPTDCIQIWSVVRNVPKEMPGCDLFIWLSTRDTSVHFWTQANNIQSFAVLDNGIERIVCPAAPPDSQDSPTTCDVYVSGGGSVSDSDFAPFIYLAYNANAIAFINPTLDKWMVTNQTNIVNNNPNSSAPGATLVFGDTTLLSEEFRIGMGDVTRLAPQQCIMFTASGTTVDTPPEPCMAIGQRSLDANTAFWRADFIIQSSNEEQVTCPEATSDELMVCIAPR
jgi:hypothetical protein